MSMKKKFTWFRYLSLLGCALALLSGCAKEPNEGPTDRYGNPCDVTINRVDHIDPPADFEESRTIIDSRTDQKKKFNFTALPGESVSIVNPSPEAISEEEVQDSITIRDGYSSEEEDSSPTLPIAPTKKKFALYDASNSKRIDSIAPRGAAVLRLEEPTKGGDLTIYSKKQGSLLNFQGKDPSVEEYIVATTREDVEEFSPNAEIPGLLYSKVLDFMDLETEISGHFLYSEPTHFAEGDQFFLGEHETFDNTATYYTFLSEKAQGEGYLIEYTVPDYGICFHQFNCHVQEKPVDFSDPDTALKIPDEEELIRALDKEGGLIDLYEKEVIPEMAKKDPRVLSALNWDPTISINLRIKRFTVSVALTFTTEGSSVISRISINLTCMVKANSNGNINLRVNIDLYFKKTLSSYCDFQVSLSPYPKINYIVALKSIDEISVNVSLGVGAGLKNDVAFEHDTNKADIRKAVEEAVNPADDGGDSPTYGKDLAGTGYYTGDGVVIGLFGVTIPYAYVSMEVGLSVFVSPILNGRVFFSYNKEATSIVCKVSKGFEMPEAYSDKVEYSRSNYTIGLVAQVGLEIGLMIEFLVYPTGAKAVFYCSISFCIGVYLLLNGVAMVTWGSQIDTTVMGYLSIEIGAFFRINIGLLFFKGKISFSFKAFEKRWVHWAFGTNLHFLSFADKRGEFDWVGGHYININDMGILRMNYFSTQTLTVSQGTFDWNYKAYFASYLWAIDKKIRLFDDLKILSGGEYLTFKDDKGWFEVKDDAPIEFTFSFRVSIDSWLGMSCDDKTWTVHYHSDKVRAIAFEGVSPQGAPDNVGGGLLEQGDFYTAPNLPDKDGVALYGWLGDNGLFLRPGEKMEVGAMGISFRPIYQPLATYVVKFFDGKNNLLSTQNIAPGGSAVEPTPATRDQHMDGATFVMWDRSFDDVHSNFNVYGIYAKGGKQA